MNKELLRQYAEAGVRNRLKDIQKELDELYREFPSVVANQNGSIPTVSPLEWKPGRAAPADNAGRMGRLATDPTIAKIAAYLTTHPGALTKDIAAGTGFQSTTYFGKKLTMIANKHRIPTGRRGQVFGWHLKDSPILSAPLNGNGASPHPALKKSKLLAKKGLRKNGKPRTRAENLTSEMVINLLREKPGLSFMEIARELNRSPTSSSMQTMIKKLAQPTQAGKFKTWTLKAKHVVSGKSAPA